MARRPLPFAALALAGLVAVAGCGGSGSSPTPNPKTTPVALHGAVPNQKTAKPEFALPDTAGHHFDLGARTRGRVTLLYFGYTHCPDQCPDSMAALATALRDDGPAVAHQVDVVFVSTDPWRDRAPVLRKWLNGFDHSFIGLTGTPQQVAGAEVAVGMPISKRRPAKKSYGSGRYAVDHFAAVLAYGRNGRLATLYPSGVTPADIAADLKVLVKG